MHRPLEVRLPRQPTCAAIARRLTERTLTSHLERARLDDVKLVVTELVDNAYMHGRGEIIFRLRHEAQTVRVDVLDQGQGAAIQIAHRADELGGHGLRLVDALSDAWGTVAGTSHVWAELPVG